MAITGDQSLLKRINRMGLIRLVKTHPGYSRADLAKHTGLTKSTVSLLIQELIEEGWLCEMDVQATKNIGRRPTPLMLDPARLALLGAEIDVDSLNVVACNLHGELLASKRVDYSHVSVEKTVEKLSGMVKDIHRNLLGQGRKVLGLGVGLPGVVDTSGSVLRFAPNLSWRDVPIEKQLRQGLKKQGLGEMPITILNAANAAALSECIFGAEPHVGSLVYLSIGIGLGGGIVLDDELYRGFDGMAGEVGHTILQLNGPQCSCGRHGCAETFVSQRAVSRAVTGKMDEVLSIDELRELLARGDKKTGAALKTAGIYLGSLLQNMINTLNPKVIVLGGPLCSLDDMLIQTATESMALSKGEFDVYRTDIRLCRFGVNASAVGAAGLILHQFCSQFPSAPHIAQ
jgi:predicted NBD/HSP70 family sugar kinase